MTTATYDVPPAVAAVIADGVAEYDRVSRDRTGAGLAVDRQHNEITEANGGAPGLRYKDNDMSAYSGKPRPDYLRLLEDIAAGLIRVLWVWHTDRLHRSNRELEEFITIIETAERVHGIRVEIRSVIGSVLDLNTATGRAHARFLATVATLESDLKSERIRAKVRQKMQKGEFMGGKRRWGYNADMSALNEHEAVIIRGIAADIIAGRSLHSIAKELNADGTPPPSWKGIPFAMSPWTGSNLGTLLRRPHLAGLASKRTPDGKAEIVGPGNWPAVLDRETWDAVCGVLSDGGRRTSTGTARKWLLSGLLRCGVCGGPLRARNGGSNRRAGTAYACPDAHVHRAQPALDALVSELAIARLSDPGFSAAFLPVADDNRETVEARIVSLEDQLDGLIDDKMAGRITERQLHRATANTTAEIARLRGLLQSMAVRATLPRVFDGLADNPDAATVWDGLGLDRRRAVIAALMTVHVDRAARRGATFDPDTVRVEWKTDAGLDSP